MSSQQRYNVIAVIATSGMLAWMMTDFFGGMFIHLLMYGIIIIPLIILYLVSFADTIISLARRGFKSNKIKVLAHCLVFCGILLSNLLQSELLKSKRILTATLVDDHCFLTLVFRANGTCENQLNGMFGLYEVYHGRYRMQEDTIIFSKKPYDNDFIPDTLLIDTNQKAIFLRKDNQGKFITKKIWLNHFVIQATP